MLHMRRGEFEAAWKLADAALHARAGVPCWHLPRHFQYIWDGRPLTAKRVLIRCYHGLGDTLQFIRYAPRVKAIAAEVVVWAQPELIALLRTMRGIDRLLPLHDGTPEVEYDADVELMELPHVFRTTLSTIPSEVPYLHADAAPLEDDGRLKVGLVWHAGDWDPRRSIPFALFAPLARHPGITLHILQRGPALAERHDGVGVISSSDDVCELARVLRALDLLISVDTMPAHLAGALGLPVWNLLHTDADWRWMKKRDDSPWYPTMRLFRQERLGDWEPVIAGVMAELRFLKPSPSGEGKGGGGSAGHALGIVRKGKRV